ncbi:M23 family metallopeptidase [Tomitella gaofuii]|uniref:M23 family metallopeptidase n=1 Tax=Tomitella gaofuii TaxID=2760083 RepID=UPI0015FCE6C5|nr:M23 family metallopeptidase [Tomitella gaofuii]
MPAPRSTSPPQHAAPRTPARSAGRIAAALCLTAACAAPALAVPAAPPAAGIDGSAQAVTRPTGTRPAVYDWPLGGAPEVTRGFDKPQFRYGPGHRGVDLAAAPGVPVRAAGPGVVAFAGPVAGRGVVSIDHPTGLRTTYEPLTPAVHAGDPVTTGTVIGRLSAGHTGCPRAACLHWGLRDGRDYLDPRSLLGTITVRLLPV